MSPGHIDLLPESAYAYISMVLTRELSNLGLAMNRNLRYDILIPAFALSCFGLLFVYSSSTIYAFEKYNDEFLFLKKHSAYLILGCFALICGLKIPLDFMIKHAYKIYGAAFIICCITLTPWLGKKAGGAARWLKLGPFQFQPSEFLKISSIILVTYLIQKYQKRLIFLWPLLLSFVILLLQPDFGSTVVLILSILCCLYIAGLSRKYFLGLLVSLIPILIILVFTKAYRLQRLLSFLDPYADPLGKGFQVIQSFVAVAHGGVLGQGLGESQQKLFFLPEAHTDFILAVIAEETGFIGVFAIFALYGVFFFSILKILLKTKKYEVLLTGLLSLLFFSMIINTGVVSGLLPTKGLPLPFISSGGSALMANFFILGLILQISNYESKNAHVSSH